jgi:hypothetical protein
VLWCLLVTMKRRRTSRCSADDGDEPICIPRTKEQDKSASDVIGVELLKQVLAEQGVHLPKKRLDHLAYHINRSIRVREAVRRRVDTARLPEDDIIRLIIEARDIGDYDEAVWRAFLAAHFGRESADPNEERQVTSASRLLNAFGSHPHWTWKTVSRRPDELHRWLHDHREDLRRLHYGNHRKMEAKKPEVMWKVVESFITLANEHGVSPMSILTDDVPETASPQERFDLLYQRLKQSLWRFGRTGIFDFLILLAEMKLIDAIPGYCYLKGSTGPRQGAELVWGKRPIRILERLAAELTQRLGVSPAAMEDALCNWQKDAP